MYIYKSLYAIKMGRGLLSEDNQILLYDNLDDALDKTKEIEGIVTSAVDLYDYYKSKDLINDTSEDFYKRISRRLHEGHRGYHLVGGNVNG